MALDTSTPTMDTMDERFPNSGKCLGEEDFQQRMEFYTQSRHQFKVRV